MSAKIPTPRKSELTGRPVCKHIPAPYKLRNYYTPEEVAKHNTSDNCWVSLFNKVYDLTTLVLDNIDKEEADPIKKAAGTDLTVWFDSETTDPTTFIHPETN